MRRLVASSALAAVAAEASGDGAIFDLAPEDVETGGDNEGVIE